MCDGTQNLGRYRYRYFFPALSIFDTDTGTSFGIKFFRYRFRDFFPVPNFADTGSETFYRYQIWPIPVPRLFSGTKFVPIPVPIPPKKWKIPGTGNYWYVTLWLIGMMIANVHSCMNMMMLVIEIVWSEASWQSIFGDHQGLTLRRCEVGSSGEMGKWRVRGVQEQWLIPTKGSLFSPKWMNFRKISED